MFTGQKWTNVSVGEMFCFFVLMIIISLEHRNMGGYIYYFHRPPLIHVGTLYNVRIIGYNPWDRVIMTLARFKTFICVSS